MSGGAYDYVQFKIDDAADQVQRQLQDAQYAPMIEEQMRKAIEHLRLGAIYLHRLDWLFSGDDDANAFFRRLDQDLHEFHRRRGEG